MTSVEEIEESLKPFLLTDLSFNIEDKKIKSGKLILFSVRDFFCIFTFLDTEKQKKITYEVPYPFSIKREANRLIFDYTIETFSNKHPDFLSRADSIQHNKKPAKLYNKKLYISSQSTL